MTTRGGEVVNPGLGGQFVEHVDGWSDLCVGQVGDRFGDHLHVFGGDHPVAQQPTVVDRWSRAVRAERASRTRRDASPPEMPNAPFNHDVVDRAQCNVSPSPLASNGDNVSIWRR